MKNDKPLDLILLLIQFLIHDLSIYTSELEPVWLDRTRLDETGFWPVHDIEIDTPRSKNPTKNPTVRLNLLGRGWSKLFAHSLALRKIVI